MSPTEPRPPRRLAEPPALPAALLDPVPMIAVGTIVWLAAAIASFTIADLATWRPVTIAGLGVGALGTGIFRWQRSAARRGTKGAQDGLADL